MVSLVLQMRSREALQYEKEVDMILDLGYIIGYVGVVAGLFVAPAQLIRILRTKCVAGISITTYLFLILALICYLLHAIYIRSEVFILAQCVNLVVNTAIFVLLVRGRKNEI